MTAEENIFAPLEAKLSPHAKHVYEAYITAFWRAEQTATVGQIRAAIKLIYGADMDHELEQHIKDRCAAVLPARPTQGDEK